MELLETLIHMISIQTDLPDLKWILLKSLITFNQQETEISGYLLMKASNLYQAKEV